MHLFIKKGMRRRRWGGGGGVVVFLKLLKDILKQIINTCNHIMLRLMNKVNLLCILDANNLYGWEIFFNIYLVMDLNG